MLVDGQGKRILIDVFLVEIQSVRAEEARFLRCLEAYPRCLGFETALIH